MKMTVEDRIREQVIAYKEWSPAERRKLEAIIEEVLTHCRVGNGNRFIAEWCQRNLKGI